MRFHIVYRSSVSACFELDNTLPYYAPHPFDVKLDGEVVLTDVRTNVFSIFDLHPGREYCVSVGDDDVVFETRKESAAISVKDFGAVGDGVTDDTGAIQSAILICPNNGRVVVPAGNYRIRPIVLKSHMTIELREGATLLGDNVEEHYPVLSGEIEDAETGEKRIMALWEGYVGPIHQSLISAYYAEDIVIVGRGVIDGDAQNSTWWHDVKSRKIGRPQLFFTAHCEHITVHGITAQNSPAWNLHPSYSRRVHFYDVWVKAPSDSPNTDGADPESCDRVDFIGMRFSVGDDAIAIKSGKKYVGMKYRTPASRHVIRNCLMERAHGAVVLGSEMSAGIRDLTVSQCYFSMTDRGLRIKTRRGRGKYSVVDGVEFSNIIMDNVMTPLVINMYYNCDVTPESAAYVASKEPQPVNDDTPYLGAFTFRNIECRDCEWAAGYFYGLPEMPIDSVTIDNVSFTYKPDASAGQPAMMDGMEFTRKLGLSFNEVKNIRLRRVTISGQDGEELLLNNVSEVIKE